MGICNACLGRGFMRTSHRSVTVECYDCGGKKVGDMNPLAAVATMVSAEAAAQLDSTKAQRGVIAALFWRAGEHSQAAEWTEHEHIAEARRVKASVVANEASRLLRAMEATHGMARRTA